jgi:hypothetical protein
MLAYSHVQVLLMVIALPGDSLLYRVWREADRPVVAVIWHMSQPKLRVCFQRAYEGLRGW